jgi:hypothetical protein
MLSKFIHKPVLQMLDMKLFVITEEKVQPFKDGHKWGQSELAPTNAPVGRSVHRMGCVFSFGAGWGSSQSISFCC